MVLLVKRWDNKYRILGVLMLCPLLLEDLRDTFKCATHLAKFWVDEILIAIDMLGSTKLKLVVQVRIV